MVNLVTDLQRRMDCQESSGRGISRPIPEALKGRHVLSADDSGTKEMSMMFTAASPESLFTPQRILLFADALLPMHQAVVGIGSLLHL